MRNILIILALYMTSSCATIFNKELPNCSKYSKEFSDTIGEGCRVVAAINSNAGSSSSIALVVLCGMNAHQILYVLESNTEVIKDATKYAGNGGKKCTLEDSKSGVPVKMRVFFKYNINK